MSPTCEGCVYANPAISDIEEEGPLMFCHRYPPQLFILDGELTQAYPQALNGCGEYVG
jgi:hypothetical protein